MGDYLITQGNPIQEAAPDAARMNGTAVHSDPLKIVIVTEDEPFHLAETISRLIATRPPWLEIAGVAVLKFSPMGRDSRLSMLRSVARTYGRLNLCVAGAKAALNRLRPARRLTTVLRRSDVAMRSITSLDERALSDHIVRHDPDVVVTLALNRIVPSAVFRAGRAVWMNVHLGLLPQNRGPAPVFWALHDGARETGVTVHLMTEKVDAGDILARRIRPIAERRMLPELRALRLLSVDALFDALAGHRAGRAPAAAGAPWPWRGMPGVDNVETFLARGNRFF